MVLVLVLSIGIVFAVYKILSWAEPPKADPIDQTYYTTQPCPAEHGAHCRCTWR